MTYSNSLPSFHDQIKMESLANLPAGGRGRVQKLSGGRDFASRVAAMGFTPGAEVSVIQNYGHGPVIVSVRDTRVALGRGEALKILVEEL
jgi:ferrous iron transport protein A